MSRTIKNTLFYRLVIYRLNELVRIGISGKLYDKITLCHGSTWWAITEECARYTVDFVEKNKDYSNFLKYAAAPDETFFVSIVKSSPFAGNISHDFEKIDSSDSRFLGRDYGCHYIHWEKEKKNTPHPKTLDESDIDNLLNSKALFARKFREESSDKLRQMLEKVIAK